MIQTCLLQSSWNSLLLTTSVYVMEGDPALIPVLALSLSPALFACIFFASRFDCCLAFILFPVSCLVKCPPTWRKDSTTAHPAQLEARSSAVASIRIVDKAPGIVLHRRSN